MWRPWRVGLGVALGILFMVAGGATYEQLARRDAWVTFPPQGRLVDIGGRRIQLDCSGKGSPVVVFESGLGLDGLGSLSWTLVRGAVAKTTRACAYSRAGFLWSDPSTRQFSSANAAQDLRAALRNAGEKPPFVLVGHSLGGLYALVFTRHYGKDVAGLVLVDAAHPFEKMRIRAAVHKDLDPSFQIRLGALFAWSGLTRLILTGARTMPQGTPESIDAANRAFLPQSLDAMLAEDEAVEATFAEAAKSRHLGDRPLFVLTHGATPSASDLTAEGLDARTAARIDAIWLELQNDETTWSSASQHEIVAGASHFIQFDRPKVVIDAVDEVVAEVRQKGSGH